MNTYEVGIVGAGIHGASAAFHLASRGISTVIFDKGGPASGPTGRSSAVCRAYYTNDFLARVAQESIGMFGRFSELTHGGDAGFVRTGALFLHPEAHVEALKKTVPHLNQIGVTTELVPRKELERRHPAFDFDGVAIGALEKGAGFADPAGATKGLFDRAVTLGAKAKLYTAVEEIAPKHEGGAVLTAGGQTYACKRLLIAAGPWTRPLAKQIGVDLPLTVERHIVATFGWGKADPIPFVFADLPGGYYCKPEGEGQFGLGPLDAAPQVDPDDFSEDVGADEVAELAQAVVDRVPGLAEAEAHGGWASLYDVSPDWQPIIGELSPGIFVDAGTSGHGFKLAPALGRHVADLVTGRETDLGLAQFHPRRFAENRPLVGGYGDMKILG